MDGQTDRQTVDDIMKEKTNAPLHMQPFSKMLQDVICDIYGQPESNFSKWFAAISKRGSLHVIRDVSKITSVAIISVSIISDNHKCVEGEYATNQP